MKIKQIKLCFVLLVSLSTIQFSVPPADLYFQDIPSGYSGIHFSNNIKINVLYTVDFKDQVNPSIHYPYGSNSSGVGVGDFNNDGLTDIFFSGNAVPNKLYLNKGNFKFEDVSEKAGIAGNGTWGVGVSVVDINGDGLLDVYVSHSGDFADPQKRANELFINEGLVNGVPHFKEAANEYGLDLPGSQTTQVAFFDYDRDGDLDAFVLNHALQPFQVFRPADFYRQNVDPDHADHLLRNDKGHFTDVTKEAGIIGTNLNFGLGVVISDINNDGWPDIYCTSDFTERDFCYLNQHNGTFKEVAGQGFTHMAAASMGVDAADFNNDGLVDFVNVEMKSKTNYRQKLTGTSDNEDDFYRTVNGGFLAQYGRNMLQVNQGMDKNGLPHFSEIGQMSGMYATEWSWSPLFADFDNDGWKDLFISAGFPDDLSLDKRNNFMQSLKTDKNSIPAGNPDFLGYLTTNSFFYRNNTKEGYADVTAQWKPENLKMSYAASYADFDNDGSLDLVISNLNAVPTLLKNTHASKEGNYLSVSLKEKGNNHFAIGAKVFVESGGKKQMQELEPVRGYASSQDYNLHFGLGKEKTANIRITWPDGTFSLRNQVPANSFLTIEKEKEKIYPGETAVSEKKFAFTEIPVTGSDSFLSRQNDHPDFKYQFSMLYKVSDFGQVVAAGDINGDGLTDYYIGGEAGIEKFFMLGKADGQFTKYRPGCFELADDNSAAILVDVDHDGDRDLLVTSRKGRVKQPQTYYTDTSFVCRIYENTGNGRFRELLHVLPATILPCKVLAAADIDNDGDTDFFIGGYNSPLNFGKKTKSYVLRNDSKPGRIAFTDVSKEVLPEENLGMITSAEWSDMDHDRFPELLLATEWGPCKLLKNRKGKLADDSKNAGLQKYSGLWSLIYPADINGDGYTDLVVGNVGQNNQLSASSTHPMKLSLIDFDNMEPHASGAIPVMSMYEEDKEYPVYYRDELLSAVQKLRAVYPDYQSYATTTVQDMISKSGAFTDTVLECNTLQSGVFINDGRGHFTFSPFPAFAQISRVNAAAITNFNHARQNDLLIAGNFFGYKIQFGREDALPVVALKNKGDGRFEAERPGATGLFSTGQVSKLFVMNYRNKKRVLIFRKNEVPQLFEYDNH